MLTLIFIYLVNIIDSPHLRRQPSMHAQDLLVDDGRKGHVIEDIDQGEPDSLSNVVTVLLQTLIHQTVDHGSVVVFMVASEKEASFRLEDLADEEEDDRLHSLNSTVSVVS